MTDEKKVINQNPDHNNPGENTASTSRTLHTTIEEETPNPSPSSSKLTEKLAKYKNNLNQLISEQITHSEFLQNQDEIINSTKAKGKGKSSEVSDTITQSLNQGIEKRAQYQIQIQETTRNLTKLLIPTFEKLNTQNSQVYQKNLLKKVCGGLLSSNPITGGTMYLNMEDTISELSKRLTNEQVANQIQTQTASILNEMNNLNEAHIKQLIGLRGYIIRMTNENNNENEELKKEIDRLLKLLDDYKEQLRQIKEGAGEDSKLILSVEGLELNELKKIYNDLKSQLTREKASRAEAELTVKDLQGKLTNRETSLNNRISEKQKELDDLTTALESEATENTNLRTSTSHHISNTAVLTSQIATLENTLNEIKAEINANFNFFSQASTAKQAVKNLIDRNKEIKKYEPTWSKTIGDYTGINWIVGKVGTTFTVLGFGLSCSVIVPWILKLIVAYKTAGLSLAVSTANKKSNRPPIDDEEAEEEDNNTKNSVQEVKQIITEPAKEPEPKNIVEISPETEPDADKKENLRKLPPEERQILKEAKKRAKSKKKRTNRTKKKKETPDKSSQPSKPVKPSNTKKKVKPKSKTK